MRHRNEYLIFTAITILLELGCVNSGTDTSQDSKEKTVALPKMKMTTEIPEGIATPDLLETSIGTLTSFDGVPDKKTTQLVYDNLDLQRATQAFLSTIQVASMSAMEKGMLGFGPPNETAFIFEELMDSKALWLTPNTVSIYMGTWMELKD